MSCLCLASGSWLDERLRFLERPVGVQEEVAGIVRDSLLFLSLSTAVITCTRRTATPIHRPGASGPAATDCLPSRTRHWRAAITAAGSTSSRAPCLPRRNGVRLRLPPKARPCLHPCLHRNLPFRRVRLRHVALPGKAPGPPSAAPGSPTTRARWLSVGAFGVVATTGLEPVTPGL